MSRARVCGIWLLAVSVFLPFTSRAGAQPDPRSEPAKNLTRLSQWFEEMAWEVSPAVVQIVSSGYGPITGGATGETVLAKQQSGGSGVIVDPAGYIVTNNHVVEGAQRIQVLLTSGHDAPAGRRSILKPRAEMRTAQLIGVDAETDLAVLRIDGAGLPFLQFGDSEALRPGQIAFAFGSPLGLENSVTMGVVSSVARQLEADDSMIYIQTDAAINPGNSGGPLVSTTGEVVGINTMILSQSGGNEGIGLAVPSNIVRTIYQQIRDQGFVRRGEIGASAQTITPLLARGLGLARDWGVVVGDVEPDGPAAITGLKIADIILSASTASRWKTDANSR
jgi:serine protease Do